MADFDDFMRQREAASNTFVEGDAKALLDISATQDPATIFGPQGTIVSGATEVDKANIATASRFAEGSENRFGVLHKGQDGDLAYWVGIQYSKVKMKDSQKLVPMNLRVTEIFRKENGEWKLMHRHADALHGSNA